MHTTTDSKSIIITTHLPSSMSQIAIATLRQAVELLGGDGTVPHSWPIELEGSAFHAPPVPHDVDGDGIQVSRLIQTMYRIQTAVEFVYVVVGNSRAVPTHISPIHKVVAFQTKIGGGGVVVRYCYFGDSSHEAVAWGTWWDKDFDACCPWRSL